MDPERIRRAVARIGNPPPSRLDFSKKLSHLGPAMVCRSAPSRLRRPKKACLCQRTPQEVSGTTSPPCSIPDALTGVVGNPPSDIQRSTLSASSNCYDITNDLVQSVFLLRSSSSVHIHRSFFWDSLSTHLMIEKLKILMRGFVKGWAPIRSSLFVPTCSLYGAPPSKRSLAGFTHKVQKGEGNIPGRRILLIVVQYFEFSSQAVWPKRDGWVHGRHSKACSPHIPSQPPRCLPGTSAGSLLYLTRNPRKGSQLLRILRFLRRYFTRAGIFGSGERFGGLPAPPPA